MRLDLQAIAAALGVAYDGPSAVAAGYSIDTRTIVGGDLFFALPGEQVDGHRFVVDAFAKQAVAAIVSERQAASGAQLVVPDVTAAMQRLAVFARACWTGQMVCVTGSAGKTTTKDVIAAMLSTRHTTGKTTGNFNNHLGVPLSLLRLPDESEAAVLELGMNHAGEIAQLARYAQPRVGVVTNVGYAHIENFDSIDGIAAAKRELVEALPSDGLAVLNADDARVAGFASYAKCRVVTFGIREPASVRAVEVEYASGHSRFRLQSGEVFTTPLQGRIGVLNVLAGIAVGLELGVGMEAMQQAASNLEPGPMRGQRLIHRGIDIINDCYNSNPDAAMAMLDLLRDMPAQRHIAVLGEMLELGRWAESLHEDVGRHAVQAGITVLVGIRGAARSLVEASIRAGLPRNAAYFFEDPIEAGQALQTIARAGDLMLFKGSRGTRVERALERFLQ